MNVANPKEVTQLTFSEYDSTSPYYDPQTNSVFYAADKDNVFNLFKLDLNTGEKIQYTDVISGNFSPVVFREQGKDKIAFTSFFKGDYRFFIMDLPQPIAVIPKGSETGPGIKTTGEQLAEELVGTVQPPATPVDFTADFRPNKQVTIDPGGIQKKKFRPILAARPSVITGVSGDTFAVAAGVAIQDILGDQEFQFFVGRINGFQSYSAGYLNIGHRFQHLSTFIFNDDYFIAALPGPVAIEAQFTSAIVRNRIWGGSFVSQYPLSRFYRLEANVGIFDLDQQFQEDFIQFIYDRYLIRTGQRSALFSGGYLPLGGALVGETTRFREFGPLSGFTFRLGVNYSPPVNDDWISRAIYSADVRKYFRLSNRTVLAARGRGFYSDGDDPVIFSFGGGLDIPGYDFRQIIGNKGGIANVELRFPLFPNPRVPILGQLRGKVFIDYFRVGFLNDPGLGVPENDFLVETVNGMPFVFDLEDGAGSIGFGFTVFAGGLPFHFDFSRVYGQGRFPVDGLIDVNSPTQLEFADGIRFDFSMGYDF